MQIFIPDTETAESILVSLFNVYVPGTNAQAILDQYEGDSFEIFARVLKDVIPLSNEATELLANEVTKVAEMLLGKSEAFTPGSIAGQELSNSVAVVKRSVRNGPLDVMQFKAACARLDINLS